MMKASVSGRLKNTTLPRTKPLLPLFETVMNSFQAIEEAGKEQRHKITIRIERQPVLDDTRSGSIFAFIVTDTGIGFTDANYDSFNTVDTQHKAGLGGKGLGRFLWLKAFTNVEIDSHYRERSGDNLLRRTFTFEPADDEGQCKPVSSSEQQPQTTVRLAGYRSPYVDVAPQGSAVIAQRLVEHFLPLFMNPSCPLVTLIDGDPIDLNAFYRDHFQAFASTHEFTINDQRFTITGFRLHNSTETFHTIVFSAHYREVIKEKLDRYIPNLRKKIEDPELGAFAYLAFVEGQFLNDHVNNEQTQFFFPDDTKDADNEQNTSIFADDLSLADIRDGAIGAIKTDLQPFLDEINMEKRGSIERYITEEAPQYRVLGRYIDEFIDVIPPNAGDHALEVALHEQLYRKQRDLKQEGQRIMQALVNVDNYEEYQSNLRDFIDRFNEVGKSSLAQYIVHRRVILDLFQKALSRDQESGKYGLEETVHNLVFPMRTTSDDVPFEQQNLWIIDERLTYHSFLASDKPLNSVATLVNDSLARPDILIFDRPLTFAEGEAPLTSIVVIEFKRPARERHGDEDPVSQVYRQIRDIKEGHFKDKNGREIKLLNSQIPAYAYVICDITREVEIKAQEKDLWQTPDNMGYFGFNKHLNAYVEIISYEKLINDAKKRNRVLFEKLHIPTNS